MEKIGEKSKKAPVFWRKIEKTDFWLIFSRTGHHAPGERVGGGFIGDKSPIN